MKIFNGRSSMGVSEDNPIFILYQHLLKYDEEGVPRMVIEVIKIDSVELDLSNRTRFKINDLNEVHYTYRIKFIYSREESTFIDNGTFDEEKATKEDEEVIAAHNKAIEKPRDLEYPLPFNGRTYPAGLLKSAMEAYNDKTNDKTSDTMTWWEKFKKWIRRIM